MAGKSVLVSGVSGFVGAWTALTFLQRGWKVRGTVRSDAKTEQLRVASPELKKYLEQGQLEIVIVEDVVTGDFAAALEGMDAFAHTASPFSTKGTDNEKDFLKPALEGTRNAITAARDAGIKTFVVTSSFAANLDLGDDKLPFNGKTYSESDWNPATYEAAAKSDNPVLGYSTSKKVAEEFCWKFQKENGLEGKMNISAICPPMIYGPFVHTDKASALGESVGQVRDLVTGKTGGEVPPTGFPAYADVRDVALAHVLAAEKSTNSRFCVFNANFDNQFVVDFLYKQFPQEAQKYGVPRGEAGKYMTAEPKLFTIDNGKSRELLGLKYDTTAEQTFGDMIRDIYQHV